MLSPYLEGYTRALTELALRDLPEAPDQVVRPHPERVGVRRRLGARLVHLGLHLMQAEPEAGEIRPTRRAA